MDSGRKRRKFCTKIFLFFEKNSGNNIRLLLSTLKFFYFSLFTHFSFISFIHFISLFVRSALYNCANLDGRQIVFFLNICYYKMFSFLKRQKKKKRKKTFKEVFIFHSLSFFFFSLISSSSLSFFIIQ